MPDRRIRLFRERVQSSDERMLVGTVWTEPIPATFRGKLIGKVDQIQREDGGWVTGVIHTDFDLVGFGSEVSVDQADIQKKGDQVFVVGARLREVVMGTKPVWDDMIIKPEPDDQLTPSQRAAAFWGSAENTVYPTEERLILALQALEYFGNEVERVHSLERDVLSAKIKDAYYGARDNGGTMHTAGDDAADAILALIRGES